MLHPAFGELWEYATAKDFVSVVLITNGTMFNQHQVLSLLRNPRSKIIVSLDGPPCVNSMFRPASHYEQVMRWLIPSLAIQSKPDRGAIDAPPPKRCKHSRFRRSLSRLRSGHLPCHPTQAVTEGLHCFMAILDLPTAMRC